MFLFIHFFNICFEHFLVFARRRRNNTTYPSALSRARSARPRDRPNSFDPMASSSTPTSDLAVQSPAPASSLPQPPPAASPRIGVVDLPAGAATREDPGSAVDAAAAAAAAAASATAFAFLR